MSRTKIIKPTKQNIPLYKQNAKYFHNKSGVFKKNNEKIRREHAALRYALRATQRP